MPAERGEVRAGCSAAVVTQKDCSTVQRKIGKQLPLLHPLEWSVAWHTLTASCRQLPVSVFRAMPTRVASAGRQGRTPQQQLPVTPLRSLLPPHCCVGATVHSPAGQGTRPGITRGVPSCGPLPKLSRHTEAPAADRQGGCCARDGLARAPQSVAGGSSNSHSSEVDQRTSLLNLSSRVPHWGCASRPHPYMH